MPKSTPVQTALDSFVNIITDTIRERIRSAVLGDLTPRARGPLGRPPGRPESLETVQARQVAALQDNGHVKRARVPVLCPYPGCKNVAAPTFAMMCRDHKDLPKKEIKKYRDAAKAAKVEAKKAARAN